jgi:hypothetical protein
MCFGFGLLSVTLDNLASFAPLEVIRVNQGIDKNNDVHKGRCEEVHKVADEVLRSLQAISRKPESNTEGINLRNQEVWISIPY